ncbi:hypothetical protein MC885_008837, partial [Smutsia gigantea]
QRKPWNRRVLLLLDRALSLGAGCYSAILPGPAPAPPLGPSASPPSRTPGSGRARSRLLGDAPSAATDSTLRAYRELTLQLSAPQLVSVRAPPAGRGDAATPSTRSPTQPSLRTLPSPGPDPQTSAHPRFGLWGPRLPKLRARRKEVPSKNIENKMSSKNTENRVSSKSVENKDIETNLQPKLWSSSSLKEHSGEVGKDAIIVEKGKNNEYCFQDIDKLSNSTADDGEGDSSDENTDDDNDPHKETPAPLELMAEFLRAEMGQDYHLAKKLCEMILIYEPENPEAKEFFSLIEEMLLMEKAQNLEEDDEDSDEDSSGESEGESSEDLSEESADESS